MSLDYTLINRFIDTSCARFHHHHQKFIFTSFFFVIFVDVSHQESKKTRRKTSKVHVVDDVKATTCRETTLTCRTPFLPPDLAGPKPII